MTCPAPLELAKCDIRVVPTAPCIHEIELLASRSAEVRAGLEKLVQFPPGVTRLSKSAVLGSHVLENSTPEDEVIRVDDTLRMTPHASPRNETLVTIGFFAGLTLVITLFRMRARGDNENSPAS